MDAIERQLRAVIDTLRVCLEDHKAGRAGTASCEATKALGQLGDQHDALLDKFAVVYPEAALAPVAPNVRVGNYPVRPWLTPHQDFTLKGTIEHELTEKGVTE